MKFTRLEIPDLILIEPRVYPDARGYFYEGFRKDLYESQGVNCDFVQDNQSLSSQGVLRGLHYQIDPKAQGKLVRVVRGAIYDVAVDIRRKSPTFGKSVAVELSERNKHALFIPAGFAHGLCVLEPETLVLYKTTDYYSPQHERGILWSDPALRIQWPDLGVPFILSDKDKKFPLLKDAEVF